MLIKFQQFSAYIGALTRASQVAPVVKNLPASAGILRGADWISGSGSLGREDPLEEEMARLSSILAWKIP